MKIRIKHILCLILLFGIVNSFSLQVNAKTTIIPKQTLFLDSEEDWDYDSEESNIFYDFSFETNRNMVLATPIEVELDIDEDDESMCYEGGVRIQLFDKDGKVLQNDYVSLKGHSSEERYENYFYSDGFFMNPGSYTYRIINTSDCPLLVRFSIDGFEEITSKVKVSKNVKIQSGNWKKIGNISNNSQFPYIQSIKSSKKGLISGWCVDYDGTIYVCAKKPGTGNVTVKLKNGKQYRTKLTVTAPSPNFYAVLTDYNTRDNYFTVKFKNVGIGTLTIQPSGAYSMDVDYKSYDRKLYVSGKKAISIKPGKTKKVKFKVNGTPTWYKYSDHTIRYYFSYYGKKYLGSVWDEDSVYRKGKKWYTSYWNEDKYLEWCE